jgi:hypothetical protein
MKIGWTRSWCAELSRRGGRGIDVPEIWSRIRWGRVVACVSRIEGTERLITRGSGGCRMEAVGCNLLSDCCRGGRLDDC